MSFNNTEDLEKFAGLAQPIGSKNTKKIQEEYEFFLFNNINQKITGDTVNDIGKILSGEKENTKKVIAIVSSGGLHTTELNEKMDTIKTLKEISKKMNTETKTITSNFNSFPEKAKEIISDMITPILKENLEKEYHKHIENKNTKEDIISLILSGFKDKNNLFSFLNDKISFENKLLLFSTLSTLIDLQTEAITFYNILDKGKKLEDTIKENKDYLMKLFWNLGESSINIVLSMLEQYFNYYKDNQ